MRALPQTGVESTGFVLGDVRDLASDASTVEAFASPDSSFFARLKAMRQRIAPHVAASDVVVSHFAPYVLPVLDVVRGKPLVVQFHGPWKFESMMEGDSAFKGTIKGYAEKIVYDRAKRFIVLSRAFADVLAHEYRVSPRDIRIVPGGVDIERFTRSATAFDLRARLGWPQERKIVLSVRRLVRAKGLEHLIDAMAIVRDRVPDALCLIAGTGSLEAELRAQIARLGLDDHVRLIGFLSEDDLAPAYAAADLFVVPTVALEGFGLVVVESLASGTPVLVTPVGGLPEVVTDLDARLILDGLGAGDIARGILAALAPSSTWRPPSSEDCVAYARRFSWSSVAARVAEVYREVV
jgi:glycosyltransferase involved in cell wall biosynthesis